MVENGFYICDKCGDEMCVEGDYPLDNEFFGDQFDKYGKHYCWRCWTETDEFAETLTLDNAVKYGERDREMNDFWNSLYSREEIEELCRKDFEQMPKEIQDKYIREYAEYDPQNWAERLEIYE